ATQSLGRRPGDPTEQRNEIEIERQVFVFRQLVTELDDERAALLGEFNQRTVVVRISVQIRNAKSILDFFLHSLERLRWIVLKLINDLSEFRSIIDQLAHAQVQHGQLVVQE